MKLLRKLLDRIGPTFEKGGKLERFYPLYEVTDSFFLYHRQADLWIGPYPRRYRF